MIQSFRDLAVWQKALTLAGHVYSATEKFPKSEAFGLTSQMRRAVVSIPSNIAEGKGHQRSRLSKTFANRTRLRGGTPNAD